MVKNEAQTYSPWSKGEAKFGIVNHLILGEIGASFWGMPDFVVDVASNHHSPCSPGGLGNVSLRDIVGFASQLSHWLSLEPCNIDRVLLRGFATKFGFYSEELLDAYVQKIRNYSAGGDPPAPPRH